MQKFDGISSLESFLRSVAQQMAFLHSPNNERVDILMPYLKNEPKACLCRALALRPHLDYNQAVAALKESFGGVHARDKAAMKIQSLKQKKPRVGSKFFIKEF